MGTGHHARIAVAVAVAALAASIVAPASATATPGAPRQATVSRVTLVTGEQVALRTDAAGRQSAAVASAGRSALLTYRIGSTSYFVPPAAAPFVGAQLDPALFGSTSLSDVETAGMMPVLVRWHGAVRPSMPWLVGPHDAGAGTVAGTVTRTSGADLERDLATQSRSARSGWTGALQGVDGITLGGSTAARLPSPRFPMFTLTVRGIDPAGNPDTGDTAIVLNTDNAAKFIAFAFWNHGVLKLSVPNGHYSVLSTFFAFSPTSAGFYNTVMDFVVRGTTTVTVDARTATARVSEKTPRTAPSGSGSVQVQRNAATGGGASSGVLWSFGPGIAPLDVFVSPAPAPTAGTQSLLVSFHLDSPAGGTPYTYDIAFESVGAITADQQYVVARSQLAAVDTRYHSDVPTRETGEARASFFPDQFFSISSIDAFAAPLERTEYVTALPELVWSQLVIDSLSTFEGFFNDTSRVFTPGSASTADWGRGPIGPGVAAPTGGAPGLQGCPACVESGTLEFVIFPFGDNPPGHQGFPNTGAPDVTETDAFDLVRNGSTIASGADPLGLSVPVPSGPASYQLGYAVTMSAPWWTLSTSTSTQWGFRTPAATQGVPPPGWVCFSGSAFGCNVIDMMLPDYGLPEDLTGHEASGATSFHLGIQHVLGVSVATTHGTVSVSFDGGLTWTAAHVTADPAGGFTVSYTNVPGASAASLRIHVVDADGSTLDQTVINAYAIS